MNSDSIKQNTFNYLPAPARKGSEPSAQPAIKDGPEGFDVDDEFTPSEAYGHSDFSPDDFEIDDQLSDFVKNTKEPVVTEFNLFKSISGSGKQPETLTIIHTNDIHGRFDPSNNRGGIANLAGKIEELKKKDTDYILLDAGDISYNPPYSDRNRFNPFPEIMNKIGYTAMGAGNHEFQWEAGEFDGPEGNPNPDLTDNLKELTQSFNFPMLCANAVRSSDGKRPDYIKPYTIKQVGDVKVGIVGVVTKRMATDAHPTVAQGWKILDQSEVLKNTIPEMKKEGANVIVVVSHDNLNFNKGIIERTRGIDIVVGGHDHQNTDQPIMVQDPDGKNVPLVEAGAYGFMVGELKVEVDPDSKTVNKVTSTLYPVISGQTKPDQGILDIVNKWAGRRR